MTLYPEHLISTYQTLDGINIILRPVRREDAELIQEFFHHLSSKAKHSHFQEQFRELSNNILNRLIQADYEHEMVFLATQIKNNKETMMGMAQYAATINPDEHEVLVVVADEWHRKGIATQLMKCLIKAAQENNIKKMIATIPAINAGDLAFAKSLGFLISDSDDPTLRNVTKLLS